MINGAKVFFFGFSVGRWVVAGQAEEHAAWGGEEGERG